jgi:hypothetical protein
MPPDDLSPLHGVTAGWRETCALDDQGHPHCWGEVDPVYSPDPQLTLSTIELGQGFGCGLTLAEGALTCWGRDGYGQASPSEGIGYTSLSVGTGQHACAIDAEGRARCWGDSADGKTLAPATLMRQISVGRDHACGVTQEDEVRCWGVNSRGQTRAPSGAFTWVTAGPTFSCGLRAEGSLSCWGTLTPEPAPLFQRVSVGAAHGCAVKADQTLSCWGWPRAGRETPPSGPFTQIAVGVDHSCAIDSDRLVQCWGVGIDPNRFERDGDFDQASPLPSLNTQTVSMIAVGDFHSCVITTSGDVSCWGDSRYGQTTTPVLSAAPREISLGARHSCVLTEVGEAICWGDDQAQQLAPPEDTTFTQIHAAGDMTCGVTPEHLVSCWGALRGIEAPREPVDLLSLGDGILCVQYIGSNEVTCQVATNIGDQPTIRSLLVSDEHAVSLSSGAGAACAIRDDERLSCEGDHAPQAYPPSSDDR